MKEPSVELDDRQHVLIPDTPNTPDIPKGIEVAENPAQYLTGIRLYGVTAILCLCLFLTNLEVPIVSTSLRTCLDMAGGFHTFAGVLVVCAKLSDIFGRKTCIITSIGIFVVFSAACGGAQTMTQLIVFRALQGLGGAGNYAIATIIVIEMVPPEKYAKYTGGVASVFIFSLLFGPIWGGAITQHSTWRWIFLLNIPPGVIAIVCLVLLLPNGFPFHYKSPEDRGTWGEAFMKAYHRIDIIGAFSLTAATVLVAAGLNEANEEFSWRSAFTITVLVLSGLMWIFFTLWERRVTLKATLVEPVFPWRFFKNRVWMAMLLNSIFLGMNWFAAIFIIPQRFEIVNSLSPFQAAVRFIPFSLLSPIGSLVSPGLAKGAKVPMMYFLVAGAAVQIVGYGLLGTLPTDGEIRAREYGYLVLAGFGCGLCTPILTLMAPFATEKQDHAVAMGAIAQFRILGGSIGLAIVTAIEHSYLRGHLSKFLTGSVVKAVLDSTAVIASLPSDTQAHVRGTYGGSYNLQMNVLAGMAGIQLLTSFLMWQNNLIRVA
ncbi:MFS general substrate transporter [Penicillium malachiteum]|uniref:MFS general substrate transporter n=1 Tax=Penicillium malachiteum TaxID=1324776 RepID=UPI002549441A|nr:MFS general substrate transporter [Penicillium malachiteum]KAJ5713108.1 MFS general substrate transporter [Penicillium malachiteum]